MPNISIPAHSSLLPNAFEPAESSSVEPGIHNEIEAIPAETPAALLIIYKDIAPHYERENTLLLPPTTSSLWDQQITQLTDEIKKICQRFKLDIITLDTFTKYLKEGSGWASAQVRENPKFFSDIKACLEIFYCSLLDTDITDNRKKIVLQSDFLPNLGNCPPGVTKSITNANYRLRHQQSIANDLAESRYETVYRIAEEYIVNKNTTVGMSMHVHIEFENYADKNGWYLANKNRIATVDPHADSLHLTAADYASLNEKFFRNYTLESIIQTLLTSLFLTLSECCNILGIDPNSSFIDQDTYTDLTNLLQNRHDLFIQLEEAHFSIFDISEDGKSCKIKSSSELRLNILRWAEGKYFQASTLFIESDSIKLRYFPGGIRSLFYVEELIDGVPEFSWFRDRLSLFEQIQTSIIQNNLSNVPSQPNLREARKLIVDLKLQTFHAISFFYACQKKDYPLLHKLFSLGLTPTESHIIQSIQKNDTEMLEFLLKESTENAHLNLDINSLLALAFNYKQINIIMWLIYRGADPFQIPEGGKKGLILAIHVDNASAVKYFLDEVNVDPNSALDNRGSTPLMSAASYGKSKITQILLEYGASLEATDNQGKTALMFAAINGNIPLVEQLYRLGAAIDTQDKKGITAFMHACQYSHLAVAKLLYQYQANKQVRSVKGQTILMLAVTAGNKEVIQWLLEIGVDINARDKSGNTALILAVKRGDVVTTKLLLEKGADNEIKNNYGYTILMIALQNGDIPMVGLLLEYNVSCWKRSILVTPFKKAQHRNPLIFNIFLEQILKSFLNPTEMNQKSRLEHLAHLTELAPYRERLWNMLFAPYSQACNCDDDALSVELIAQRTDLLNLLTKIRDKEHPLSQIFFYKPSFGPFFSSVQADSILNNINFYITALSDSSQNRALANRQIG